MTQLTVAPQSMPVIAPAQAATAANAAANSDPNAVAEDVFAAVLKAQIALPAKVVPGTDIFAAQLPSQLPPQADEGAEEALSPTDGLPVAPDLAVLMSSLASLTPAAATAIPGAKPADEAENGQPAPSLVALPGAAPKSANPASPLQMADATLRSEDVSAPSMQPARQEASPSAQLAQAVPVATPIAADPQVAATASEFANPAGTTPVPALPAHGASAGNPVPVVRVDTPVGNRGWDAEVGQKIVLLANRQESRAELTLTPPQLGKLEITISVNGDQTSATFVSASPAARDALEQALPRLREMLAEAGISLGQASVNAESTQRGQDQSPTDRHGGHGTEAASGAEASTQWVRRSSGLIDTFA